MLRPYNLNALHIIYCCYSNWLLTQNHKWDDSPCSNGVASTGVPGIAHGIYSGTPTAPTLRTQTQTGAHASTRTRDVHAPQLRRYVFDVASASQLVALRDQFPAEE